MYRIRAPSPARAEVGEAERLWAGSRGWPQGRGARAGALRPGGAIPDRCERIAALGERAGGEEWLRVAPLGRCAVPHLPSPRDHTLAAGNQLPTGFPARLLSGGGGMGKMGGGSRLFARAQLPGAGWAPFGQRKRSLGRKRGRLVGIHNKRVRQGPGMVQDTIPRPYSSVRSVVPGT